MDERVGGVLDLGGSRRFGSVGAEESHFVVGVVAPSQEVDVRPSAVELNECHVSEQISGNKTVSIRTNS